MKLPLLLRHASSQPSHPWVTPNDHRSLLNVLGWFLVILFSIVVTARLGTRWARSRKLSLDDLFIVFAAVFATVQTACISIGVSHGLGTFSKDTEPADLDRQQQMIYASIILFIMSQFSAKLSISAFIIALSPDTSHQKTTFWFIGLATAWTLISVLGFAFQCDIPNPWNFLNNKCIDRVALYTFVEVYNIVLDSALAVFPSLIAFTVQLEASRKKIIIAFFMSRFLVVAASTSQLVVIYTRSEDPFLSWTFPLIVSIIQSLGIITACVPYLRPFLQSLNSGLIGNDDIRRRSGKLGNDGYKTSFPRLKVPWPSRTGLSRPKPESSTVQSVSFTLGSRNEASVSAEQPSRPPGEAETNSMSSQSRLIRQTTSYTVTSDHGGEA